MYGIHVLMYLRRPDFSKLIVIEALVESINLNEIINSDNITIITNSLIIVYTVHSS